MENSVIFILLYSWNFLLPSKFKSIENQPWSSTYEITAQFLLYTCDFLKNAHIKNSDQPLFPIACRMYKWTSRSSCVINNVWITVKIDTRYVIRHTYYIDPLVRQYQEMNLYECICFTLGYVYHYLWKATASFLVYIPNVCANHPSKSRHLVIYFNTILNASKVNYKLMDSVRMSYTRS